MGNDPVSILVKERGELVAPGADEAPLQPMEKEIDEAGCSPCSPWMSMQIPTLQLVEDSMLEQVP